MNNTIIRQIFIGLYFVFMGLMGTENSSANSLPFFNMPENITAGDYIPGKIVFRLRDGIDPFSKKYTSGEIAFSEILGSIRALDLARTFPHHLPPTIKNKDTGVEFVDLSRIFEITIPYTADLEQAINILYASGFVEYAQPYFIPRPLHTPNDPMIISQYYLSKIRAFDSWGITRGDTNVVIAIVDTGIDLFHPDLVQSIAFNYDDPINGIDCDNDGYIDNFFGWDLGENDNMPQFNTNAHGVHVGGIAGATANNGAGIAGIGYHSRLLPVKICDRDGRLVKAYEGIVYAADKGARVINLSWGGTISAGQFGQDIINYAAINRDAVVVGAAGNSNNTASFFPASYDNIISVAATDASDNKWVGSSFGHLVDVSAPGANILSTWANGTWIPSSGTSMAAPVVSGAAAILRSHFPHFNSRQIAAQLKVTSDNIDTIPENSAWSGMLGSGRINLFRALTETHHPFIELSEFQYAVEFYQSIEPGSIFPLSATFRNLLPASGNITAVLTSQNPHVEILTGTINLGLIAYLQTVNNFNNPFMIRVKEDIPSSENVFFTIRFYNDPHQFAGKESFSLTFNLDFLTINTNQVTTTINSRGNAGFNLPNINQGVGFIYTGHNAQQSIIRAAGLMIGVNTARVVDNIYGAIQGSFSGSFYPISNIRFIEPPILGDFQLTGSFDDRNAGTSRIGLKIDYNIYGFRHPPHNKFIILEYNIINISGTNQSGLHAGFFADWVIQNFRDHRAAFDPENKMGYAFRADGGEYKGISLLNHSNITHYAFDNQGFGGSIKITDGFTSFEKYTALRSARPNAGLYDKDNDISTLLGAGPFNLSSNDTLTVAFALFAGDHLNDLRATAQMASQIYNNIALIVNENGMQESKVLVYPNPFNEHFTIKILIDKPVKTSISVINMYGAKIYNMADNQLIPGLNQFEINTHNWPSGIYLLRVETENEIQTIRIIKN